MGKKAEADPKRKTNSCKKKAVFPLKKHKEMNN